MNVMFRLTMIIKLLFVLSSLSLGDDKPSSDVPETAHLEVLRRGTSVEPMGVIQAGPEAAIVQAVAPPDDDSDRWWFSVITAGANDDAKARAASKLLTDDVASLKFKQWVKPEDIANSWAHYQERRVDDPLQRDWLAPLKARLDLVGLPAIVIQPPRNEEFGKNSTVVALIGSYDGNADKINLLIEERVKAYTAKHASQGTIKAGTVESQRREQQGHAQAAERPAIKPPFELPMPVAYPPVDVLSPPKPQPEIVKPTEPVAMKFSDIRKTFPGIPEAVALDYAKRKLTEEQIIDIEHKLLEDEQTVEVDSKPAHPTKPEPLPTASLTTSDVVAIACVLIVIGGLIYLRLHTKPTPPKPTSSGTNLTRE